MNDNILFTCSALHPELTQKASSLIDGKVLHIWNTNIVEYLIYILFKLPEEIDWVVNFDEDCFIFDMSRLYGLIDYMETNDFDAAGISDGGVTRVRGHNPIAYVPFFNIFNVKKIRKLDNFDLSPFDDDLLKYSPTHLLKHPFKYDQRESDYPIYFALLRKGCKFLYLDGLVYKRDNISTYLLDSEKQPFLIHTWFARRYIDGSGLGEYPNPWDSEDFTLNSYRINDIFEKHKTLKKATKEFKKQYK